MYGLLFGNNVLIFILLKPVFNAVFVEAVPVWVFLTRFGFDFRDCRQLKPVNRIELEKLLL